MLKTSVFLLLIFSVQFFAQQNAEFKEVKKYYDNQRFLIFDAFKKEVERKGTAKDVTKMKRDFDEFMLKMDSIQNIAFIGALIKVKNREALTRLRGDDLGNNHITSSSGKEIPAEYPGGIDALRKQIAHSFYFSSLTPEIQYVATDLYFIVETDGSIADVHAEGNNVVFNRQAEIATYNLTQKFKPATLNGEKVRYHFRVPLTMKFN